MALLALDASTEACAVGIQTSEGQIFEAFEVAPRKHTELLPKMLDQVIVESKIKKTEIKGCIVGVGPGAFTGIRIGVATIQGIALGLNIPCYAVSSLHAIAQQAINLQPSISGSILSCIDARMEEIYYAQYAVSNSQSTQLIDTEAMVAYEAFQQPGDCMAIAGSGLECVKSKLTENITQIESCYPTASALFQIYQQHHLPAIAAEQLTPSYIRNQVTHQK
ncbi:MAG: tRNA (adenosine(37)-N6)-threonylcarbamoyltransferase complex dimerization subunit type 1 TsaB [Gammaproteobacteria bacterium]|nr:tRNA (adenosine(37)-N6)-threonylcarbamoyltransferase complex dimerization subunit type 1 TsaB [Gammaproteobacteria bacterium]